MADPAVDIDIRIEAGPWAPPHLRDGHAETVRRAALAALDGLSAPGPLEIGILLTDDATIAALNRQWRGRDGPTNVLSFPGDEAPPASGAPWPLGDIAVAWETLDREARRDGIPFADHLAHLVVHGVLHLRGYDHETDGEAAEMEGLEREILAGLGIADPYRDPQEALERQNP